MNELLLLVSEHSIGRGMIGCGLRGGEEGVVVGGGACFVGEGVCCDMMVAMGP